MFNVYSIFNSVFVVLLSNAFLRSAKVRTLVKLGKITSTVTVIVTDSINYCCLPRSRGKSKSLA